MKMTMETPGGKWTVTLPSWLETRLLKLFMAEIRRTSMREISK